MRVFLFGLFLSHTYLMKPLTGFVPLVLPICFHRVLLHISGFMIIIIILYMFTSCFTTCVLFHQSPALIIVHHACSLLDITYYFFACSSMPVLMTQFSMHVYKSNLSIHVCLSLHATWHSPHHSLGVSDSPISSCPDFGV